MMRLESNHARGTFNQLRVALLHSLTYRLYSLYCQIEGIKSGLEVRFTFSLFIVQSMTSSQVGIDKQQLKNAEIITSAEVARPVDGKRVWMQAWMLTNYDFIMVP
jgi:hypothetical protein